MAPKRRRADQSSPQPEPEPAPAPPLRTLKSQPVVVFAHGAGAPSSSDWMVHWKKMVQDALDAVDVVTFDYPYMSGGKRRAPPKAEKLVDHHLGVVKDAASKYQGHPIILMGKSMGSRVSCMVANSDDIDVCAVVCLGYPLKGSKDGLCPLDRLGSTRKKMTCKNELHVVDGGDHSLKVGKRYLESRMLNQHDVEMKAVKAISQFVQNSITEICT
ncbi:hypothetical protein BS78_09G085500 [Paspalum vaginatum]|nr:hypothetical protein BS78_09G085500 [Paspalum vaginatum]